MVLRMGRYWIPRRANSVVQGQASANNDVHNARRQILAAAEIWSHLVKLPPSITATHHQ